MEQNTQHTALLIMDMQTAMLGSFPDAATLIGNVAKAIANARAKKIPIIYVTVGFRPGAPEINMENKGFAEAKLRFTQADAADFTNIHPHLAPAPGEITVVKRRISAFTGSDLEVILRAFGIRHIVLTGIATSGVVLSTTREAADKDYRITILSDSCGDADPEVHRVLTTKIFTRQAYVLTTEEWCKG